MFEYLIVHGEEEMRVADFGGLLEELIKAINDDNYCFWAYEIHRIAVDFSLPREVELETDEKQGTLADFGALYP